MCGLNGFTMCGYIQLCVDLKLVCGIIVKSCVDVPNLFNVWVYHSWCVDLWLIMSGPILNYAWLSNWCVDLELIDVWV